MGLRCKPDAEGERKGGSVGWKGGDHPVVQGTLSRLPGVPRLPERDLTPFPQLTQGLAGSAQGRAGGGFQDQHLGFWLSERRPLAAARRALVVTERNGPSRGAGAGPGWPPWAMRSVGAVDIF